MTTSQARGVIDESTGGSGHGIHVENLTKTYLGRDGRPVTAIQDLTLDPIKPGEFVSIVGRSGCGKSTLLKIVAGLTDFQSGYIARDNTPVTKPSADVGMVFQSPELVPWRTALGNTLLPASLIGKPAKQYRQRAEELLAMVGLSKFTGSYPGELSGGMRHRNAIARALLLTPSVLLMDEPFAALDALTRDELMMELQRIWSTTGCTVLFVTHNITEAAMLSDRIVVLAQRPGRLLADVRVDLPRPRTLDMESTPEFGEIVHTVRSLVGLVEGDEH